MIPPTGRFRRSERLLASKDFARVARRGHRTASRCFVVLVAPAFRHSGDETPHRRIGMTTSRKVGNAVARNRIRRRIRGWFRVRRDELEDNVDIVVIARRPAAELTTDEIYRELDRLLLRGAERSA